MCVGGGDLATCLGELTWTCYGSVGSSSTVTFSNTGTIFGDLCKGHAKCVVAVGKRNGLDYLGPKKFTRLNPSPYHFHVDMPCEYSPNSLSPASTVRGIYPFFQNLGSFFSYISLFPQVTSHSPLVGVALDGKGIYGAWEGAGALPALDACGGHVGTTSGTTSTSVGAVTGFLNTNYVASSVYHYHLSGALLCQITFIVFLSFSPYNFENGRLVPVHAQLLRLRRHRPRVARQMPSAVPGHGA